MRSALVRGSAIALLSYVQLTSSYGGAWAQEVRRGTSALNLPRKGYEAKRLHYGRFVISPELAIEEMYDSNVFATSTNEEDDFVTTLSPRIDIDSGAGKLSASSSVYANIAEYLQNPRESNTTYGGSLESGYLINRANSMNGVLRYDRAVESRTDPEASDRSEPPRKIDIFAGELGYQYRRNRVGLGARAAASRLDFLDPAEDDRDMLVYRGSVRGSYLLTPRFDLYVESYANRRDLDSEVDRSGVNRDTTTLGILTGIRVDIASKWQGAIGVGVFHSNPDDRSLESFSGISASGSLTWSPDERTALIFDVFRGDVATIQSGATGRVDTRASLRLEQEVRHNILFGAVASLRATEYRGASNREQLLASIRLEGEYLLNRHLSLFVNGDYTRRFARDEDEEFNRVLVGLGVRLRY